MQKNRSIRNIMLIVSILVALIVISIYIFDMIIVPRVQPNVFLSQASKTLIILTLSTTAVLFLRKSKKILSTRLGAEMSNLFELVIIIFIAIVSIFQILHVFNVDTNTLLIGGGIISLTVGLIVSTFVGDTLAGMLVIFLSLYRVGDTVLVNSIPCRVEDVTSLVTRFRNDAGGVLTIPNTAIIQGSVMITRFHALNDGALTNRLPYAKGDRVYTTYMNATGTVEEVDPIHTRIKLDSGMELSFMNNSVLLGTIAVAKIVTQD
jgi:small-conductance mechanosensitive channel